MTIHVDDLGYAQRRRGARNHSVSSGSLEFWGAPEWTTVPTLEPIEAPTPERGSDGRMVAVAPIGRAVRDQVNRGRLTWSAIALSLGWTFGAGGGADTTRVLRRLGLALQSANRGFPPRQSLYIDRELAAQIIRAAHLDPIDVGL